MRTSILCGPKRSPYRVSLPTSRGAGSSSRGGGGNGGAGGGGWSFVVTRVDFGALVDFGAGADFAGLAVFFAGRAFVDLPFVFATDAP